MCYRRWKKLAKTLALAIGLTSGMSGERAARSETSPAPAATGAARGAAAGSLSTETTPVWQIDVLRQLLAIPTTAKVDAKAFDVSFRRWGQRNWVVLARGWRDGRASVAGLGLYGDGDVPAPARLVAQSGRLPVEDSEEVLALDLAPFRVTPSETAIGVRLQRKSWYAGGGEGSANILRLYLQNGSKLDRILSVVTDYACELAGDWNRDGTRDRNSATGQSVLVVSKRKTDGHFDWEQRHGKKTVATYRWNGSAYDRAGDDSNADADEPCEVAHPEE